MIFFSILQKGGLQPYEAALRKKARCKYGRILLLTSQFCLTWLACRSRPWWACLKIEGWRMGQKLSLALITRKFLPCQVASRAIFSNGVTEHVFRYLREDSQMKSIFQRIPSNGLYLLILGHNGSMQHWPKQSPGQTTRPSALILTMMSFHALTSLRFEHSILYHVKFQTNQHNSRPGQKNVFCNFFRWLTKMRIMMPWGT